jgi:TolA-binding protein
MGADENTPAGTPEDLQKRVAELEASLVDEIMRQQDLQKQLDEATRDVSYYKKVFDHLNKQGAALRKLLETRELRHERIRADELYLVGRYVSGSEDDIALLEKFSNADRFLSWSRHIFFEPLYALDRIDESLGKAVYAQMVDARGTLSVVDMEALVRQAFVQLQATQHDIDGPNMRGLLLDQVAGAAEGRDAPYISRARDSYQHYVKTHYAFFKSLTDPAGLLLDLRDKAKGGKWEGVHQEIEEMGKKEITKAPLLGMQWVPIEVYRQRLDEMEQYEKQHSIDLRWYRDLPKDLRDFCDSSKA